jgi:hypothetical protein
MKKTIRNLVLLLYLCFTIYGCKCYGDLESDVYSSPYMFSLAKKENGQNLLGYFGFYHEDSVKVFDEENLKVFNGPVPPDGRISFYAVRKEKDAQAFSREITRTFYLYLNQFDTDTIRMTFKLKQVKECGKRDEIDYAKIYFNDSLYVSGNALTYLVFLK